MKKKITILGSTGSIGLSSLSVIDSLSDDFELIAASAHSNWGELAKQARKYQLPKVVLTDPAGAKALIAELKDTATEVLIGPEYLPELATDPLCDTLIVSVVGAAGLPAVLAATQAGKTIAVANKESLVVAGCILMPLARETGAIILPIDSEHSAILQAMHSGDASEVQRLIITASGGPFRTASVETIKNASLADALKHPTWSMGTKISIDSATMTNKALEIIEARWLFNIPADKIDVFVHPESIIHSMVEFCDGSVIAQLSPPDMRLPIQYALTYPRRVPGPSKKLKLTDMSRLTFEAPDMERFPGLRLGFEVALKGGSAGAVFNAANEAAVEAFVAGTIGFTQISALAERALDDHNWIEIPDLDQLFEADRWAREQVNEMIQRA